MREASQTPAEAANERLPLRPRFLIKPLLGGLRAHQAPNRSDSAEQQTTRALGLCYGAAREQSPETTKPPTSGGFE